MSDPVESDPVTKALLPMLLHEVRGATQLLVGLRAMLDLPTGEALFAKRAPDLSDTSDRMFDLGFAMAVLATASGANMLMSRRDPRGVEILQDLARRAVTSTEERTVVIEGEAPRIAPSALDGWQIPWAGAALVALVPGRDWRWVDGRVLVGTAGEGAPEPAADVLASIRERCPGAELGIDGAEIVWALPAEWLL